MSSKEQPKSADKSSSNQKRPKHTTEASHPVTGEQLPGATSLQGGRPDPASMTPGEVLHLQRTVGNQAVGRLLGGQGTIQRSLRVGGEVYDMSRLRGIGEKAKEKYEKDEEYRQSFTDDTKVYKDLTWAQLMDPRIGVLTDSRERYQFENWVALQRIINQKWDIEKEDVPKAIDAYKMELKQGPMEFQGNLQELITHLGAISEDVNPGKIDDRWTRATQAETQAEAIKELQGLWGVCGSSAQSLIERIWALGGQPRKVFARAYNGKHDASELQTLLMVPVGQTAIIQLNEPLIHQFTIEKRADGKAYLHQGYLSNYNALWWAGLAEDLEPHLTAKDEVAEKLQKAKQTYGNCQPIPLGDMAGLLGQYLLADIHGNESETIWQKLPLNPGASEEKRWAGQPIKLQVEVYHLQDETTVRESQQELQKTLPLVYLVMNETKKLIDNLKD